MAEDASSSLLLFGVPTIQHSSPGTFLSLAAYYINDDGSYGGLVKGDSNNNDNHTMVDMQLSEDLEDEEDETESCYELKASLGDIMSYSSYNSTFTTSSINKEEMVDNTKSERRNDNLMNQVKNMTSFDGVNFNNTILIQKKSKSKISRHKPPQMMMTTTTTETTNTKTTTDPSISTKIRKQTLHSRFAHKMNGYITPMERIALTANGNLQRLLSSYYDTDVHVILEYCTLRKKQKENDQELPHHQIWDRCVHITVHNQNICTAYSEVTVYSEETQELIESGKVGIGQLFRYLDLLPTFELLDAGRCSPTSGKEGMWREYVLQCPGKIKCLIREEFAKNAWDLNDDIDDSYYSNV